MRADRRCGRMRVNRYRMLKTLSVGIMGLGEIGKDVAQVCSLLGMSVAGLVSCLFPSMRAL